MNEGPEQMTGPGTASPDASPDVSPDVSPDASPGAGIAAQGVFVSVGRFQQLRI